MNILAIDPATISGWAYNSNEKIYSGIWDLSIQKGQEKGMRLRKLWIRLESIQRNMNIDHVVFEGVTALKGHARRVLPQLQGIIELWCCLQDPRIPYTMLSPSAIKKHATGKGNADKEKMVRAGKKKWKKLNIFDHNQVDALWILDLALKEMT